MKPPGISLGALARLCRRLATSLAAGVDVRNVCAREAEHATGLAARPVFRRISDAVHRGDSFSEAVAAAGEYFPTLFRQMTAVGEKTGHLAEISARLAEHYDEQIRMRRMFLVAISWPMVELVIAVTVIGLLIWIVGIIGGRAEMEIDPLGLGLVGNRGLAIYVTFIAGVAATIAFVVHAIRRGAVWTGPVQKAALRIPVLGKALETICLARVAWAMHLTMGVGMEVRQAIQLSLNSARNARYTEHIPLIKDAITDGSSLFEAFQLAGDYPTEFLDTIRVGEQSGNLAESMALLSRQFHERADAALKVLTMLAGMAVWCVIAAIIILVIFRLFSFYIGTIYDAMP